MTSPLLACTSYCVNANSAGIPDSGGSASLGSALASVTNLGLTILGALAVVFMVVGGLQFILSGGNAQRTKQARETLLYSAIGLVVAGSAYAIVTFLSGKLSL